MCPTYDDLQILGTATLIGMFCCYKLGQWNGVKIASKEVEKAMPQITKIVIQQQTDILELKELMAIKEQTLYKVFFARSMN